MPFAAEAFGTLGETEILEGRHITPANVKSADLLAVRSTTRIDRELLQDSRVRFVGTATIGIDHLDTAYLDAAGIRWCYAPGCNANSVSEYVTTALLCLAQRHGWRLAGKTIGVIGVGNVGRLVAHKAAALGLRVLLNDPPRDRAGDAEDFQPLERLLAESDILALHVPLTDSGPDATRHLVDNSFFDRARRGLIFINASRGGVMRSESVLSALHAKRLAHAVIDTWENEPRISQSLLENVDIATPHIAGHSFEGKVEGTMMVYREACRFLGKQPCWDPEPHLPPPDAPRLDLSTATDANEQDLLWQAVHAIYDIEADDRRLRNAAAGTADDTATGFDTLRRNYPQRREFRFTRLILPSHAKSIAPRLRDLGFQID